VCEFLSRLLLLLITPTFSALLNGRLPIEISTRGAKFAEDAGQSTELRERDEWRELMDELTRANERMRKSALEFR